MKRTYIVKTVVAAIIIFLTIFLILKISQVILISMNYPNIDYYSQREECVEFLKENESDLIPIAKNLLDTSDQNTTLKYGSAHHIEYRRRYGNDGKEYDTVDFSMYEAAILFDGTWGLLYTEDDLCMGKNLMIQQSYFESGNLHSTNFYEHLYGNWYFYFEDCDRLFDPEAIISLN